MTLQWCHNWCDGASNRQPHDCLLNCLFMRILKKASKLCVTALCVGNSPMTGEFPTQKASNTENDFIWWRHHECIGGNVFRTKVQWCGKRVMSWRHHRFIDYRGDGNIATLTHWGRDKWTPFRRRHFQMHFLEKKMFELRLKFHWSLFPRVQLAIFQQWFR